VGAGTNETKKIEARVAELEQAMGRGRENVLPTMRLEKRIHALESRLITDPVVLHFADGSTRKMCGRGDFLLSMALGACGGADLSSGRATQLDLIRQSVAAQEPGGGHMVELLQCLLHASAEAGAL
jgi:hypothetical protein